ncbi:MAG: TolC family protein [Deltaproteobacteria bacterium]|nr:TolC family protein [Deltaproteobacteria bacterium]
MVSALKLCAVAALFVAANPAAAVVNYSVEAYTDAVLKTQPGLAAQQNQLEAAQSDERQVGLLTAPQLQTKVTAVNDRRPPLSLAPGYSSLTGNMIQASVAQQFSTGTMAKLTFDLQSVHFNDFRLSPQTPGVDQEIHTFAPSFELSQPLWRGALGRSIQNQKELMGAQKDTQSSSLRIKTKEVKLGAELAYYRLAFARDRVMISETTLSTAEKILAFVKSKQSQNLYEKGDLLQAQALVESRRLELQEALSEVRSAALAFNVGRGVMSDQVSEGISSLRMMEVAKDSPKVGVDKQPELAMIRNQIDVASSAMAVAEEQSLPSLNAFASYGLQSRFDDLAKTMRNTIDPYNPMLTVGIALDMPLDRDLVKAATEAARHRRVAAQNLLEDATRNLSRAVTDLNIKRSEAIKVYAMAKSLELVQDEKLKNEQRQYRNGRSTTYQLLMFSQDLAMAELGRVKAAYAVYVIDAQLRQFRE